MGPVIRAHNITPGMADAKDAKTHTDMVKSAIVFLQGFDKIMRGLVIHPERALEELNSDWTASQELADVLMHKYKIPFRAGHHFASEVVDYAKLNNIKPLDFPYPEAQRIFKMSVKDELANPELPMSAVEFKATLNPETIVQNRKTVGGPQAIEMQRMLALAQQAIQAQARWISSKKDFIDKAMNDLDRDFSKLSPP
jgi:argininosuccinate lyase